MTDQSKPAVSVAICTYNGGTYIQSQLESILHQTQLPDEVIVVDDLSTDDTATIVKKYAQRSSGLVQFHQNSNRLGVTKNFERAMRMASRDIVFLADQDDYWLPTKVERMTEPFRSDRTVGLVYCDAAIVGSDLTPRGQTVFSTRGGSQIWKGDTREPLDVIVNSNVKGCTLAFRNSLSSSVLPIPFRTEGSLWAHDHWIAFVLAACSTVVAIPEPLMYYRIHEANTSGNIRGKSIVSEAGGSNSVPYRSRGRYSPNQVRRRLQQIKGMENHLIDMLSSGAELPRREKARDFLSVLHAERDALAERESIMSTASHLPRALRATRHFLYGHYRRYQRGCRAFIKDVFGISSQSARDRKEP